MENSTNNNLVKTLTDSIPTDLSSFQSDDVATPSSTSFFVKFMIFIAVLILLLIGGIYLAKENQQFANFINSILGDYKLPSFLSKYLGMDTSVVNATSSTTLDNARLNKTNTEHKIVEEKKEKECEKPQNREKMMKALDNAAQTEQYLADNASSSIQKKSGKTNWCFIGEEDGTRNCAALNKGQECMSGNIFPSMDICINPNLRN
jgi:hypothetical protein